MAWLPLALGVLRVLSDDGGWCWFEDERAVVTGQTLIVGTVAAGVHDPSRRGNVEALVMDLSTGKVSTVVLHGPETDADRKRWLDDHNSPAFFARPDGRVLAMYAQHGNEANIYYRLSAPKDPARWGPEQVYVPSESSRVTYTNLHWLPAEGKLYNFFRGLHNSFKPSFAWSPDQGETWTTGNVFIDVPTEFRHRPYVKYASNGKDTVHIAYTEGHPRNFDNGIYHVYYQKGKLHASDGKPIRELREGLRQPEEGTRVFAGSREKVAWISDLHLDRDGRPVLVFSEQRNETGEDHRYHYARWTGLRWDEHEIAYAGSRLYKGEDDYTGNIALDPQDPAVVYLSTNAHPVTGKPLPVQELYRGRTTDGGAHWSFEALTRNSTEDNIRPIVPIDSRRRVEVLWLQGKMATYTNYRFRVVALLK